MHNISTTLSKNVIHADSIIKQHTHDKNLLFIYVKPYTTLLVFFFKE